MMIATDHLQLTKSVQWRPDRESIEALIVRIEQQRFPLEHELRVTDYRNGTLPNASQCVRLAERGVGSVILDEPLELQRDGPYGGGALVRFLRDTVPCGIRVFWTLDPGAIVDTSSLLSHLWPPAQPGDDAAKPRLFGVYYWRNGPGFINLQDLRPGRVPCKYTLDEPDLVELFLLLQHPTARTALPDRLLDSFEQMRAEGMVFETGEYVVALPSRVAKWPTPFQAF